MTRTRRNLQVVKIRRLMDFLWENREVPGWSVEELATKSLVPRSVAYNILNGSQDEMSLRTLERLAGLVGGEVVILLHKGKSKLPIPGAES